MPNSQIATSEDLSNIVNMVDTAFSIAKAAPGIAWGGSTEWTFPLPSSQITPPHLAVVSPTFVEYSIGYVPVGDFMDRSDQVQFTWDIDIYALSPFQAGNPKTYSTPMDAIVKLVRVFGIHENLDGTCDEIKVGKPVSVSIFDGANGPLLWAAVHLPIRCIENIVTDYTPA